MNTKLVAIALLAFPICLLGQGQAPVKKSVNDNIREIAASLKKGNKGAAQKQADALAAGIEELEEVMVAFNMRKKRGLGVGKPGQIAPDGIAAKLNAIAGFIAPAVLNQEADALEEMAFAIAAVAEINHAKAPLAGGKKTRKDWLTWSGDLRESAIGLADSVQKRNAVQVPVDARRVIAACVSCHDVFR